MSRVPTLEYEDELEFAKWCRACTVVPSDATRVIEISEFEFVDLFSKVEQLPAPIA